MQSTQSHIHLITQPKLPFNTLCTNRSSRAPPIKPILRIDDLFVADAGGAAWTAATGAAGATAGVVTRRFEGAWRLRLRLRFDANRLRDGFAGRTAMIGGRRCYFTMA